MARLGRLLEPIAVAMLTTLDAGGALVSKPVEALQMDSEGALWFFIDLRLDLAERLRAANLAFVDDSRGTYVSLSGRGEIAKDEARLDQLWTTFDTAAFPDGRTSPHLAFLKFVPEKAEYWDAPGSRAVRLLALAATAVSGTAVGQAEHGVFVDLAPAEGLAAGSPAAAAAGR